MTRVWVVTIEVRSDNEDAATWWDALGIEAPYRWNSTESTFTPGDCYADVKLEVEALRDSPC